VNFKSLFEKTVIASIAAIFVMGVGAYAQMPKSTLVKPVHQVQSLPIATGSNLYCAGYVQSSPINTSEKIVGAVNEQDGFVFSQGNYI